MSDWRNDPATKKQKDKLLFFGCAFDEGISKGQASDAIEKCIEMFPQKEKFYQARPATKEQLKKLQAYLKADSEKPEDYASGEFLTYSEAKELIEEADFEKEQAKEQALLDEIDKEYIIDVGMWAELYPGLTWKRVQSAAKSLDESRPGWRTEQNHIDLMVSKVAEQNPQLLERWNKKSEPKQKRGRRESKGNFFGVLIVLVFVIWLIWKFVAK